MKWNGKKIIYTKSALELWGDAARGLQQGLGRLGGADGAGPDDNIEDHDGPLVTDESGADGPYCYVDDEGQRYEVDIWDPELVEALNESFARDAAERRARKDKAN